jgi:hypothetical protein
VGVVRVAVPSPPSPDGVGRAEGPP